MAAPYLSDISEIRPYQGPHGFRLLLRDEILRQFGGGLGALGHHSVHSGGGVHSGSTGGSPTPPGGAGNATGPIGGGANGGGSSPLGAMVDRHTGGCDCGRSWCSVCGSNSLASAVANGRLSVEQVSEIKHVRLG